MDETGPNGIGERANPINESRPRHDLIQVVERESLDFSGAFSTARLFQRVRPRTREFVTDYSSLTLTRRNVGSTGITMR